VRHLALRTAEIVAGNIFLVRPIQRLWGAIPVSPSSLKITSIAVVAHVYYPNLLPEVLQCWRNVAASGVTSHLHITTTSAQLSDVEGMIAHLANASVHVGPNRGRDIAPFVNLLNAGVLDSYDLVLKVHTKRSPHLRAGHLRRRLLFALLAGNPQQAARICELFGDPQVGMVGWGLAFRNSANWWMGNEIRVREIAKRVTPPLQVAPGFFEGSMFWVRPSALEALRSLALGFDDFESEDGQLDGTLHHAVERVFALSAWAGGYRVHSISGKVLHAGH
jgi:rhamnosyltransferase